MNLFDSLVNVITKNDRGYSEENLHRQAVFDKVFESVVSWASHHEIGLVPKGSAKTSRSSKHESVNEWLEC